MFRVKSSFVPTKQAEPEVFEDEYNGSTHADPGIIITQPKTNYLPGERLLQKINRDKKKAKRHKNKRKKKSMPDNLNEGDVDLISASMGRVLTALA
jgi:hypothetical protein